MSGIPAPAASSAGAHTDPGAASSGGQPGQTLDLNKPLDEQIQEWQNRFAGMQKKFQAEQGLTIKTQADLSDTRTQLQIALGERDTLALAKTKVETDLANALKEKETIAAAQARTSLIALEFPGLLAFEKDGLLPPGNGDELKTKLTAFTARLGTQAAASAAAAVLPVGSTPPAPAQVAPTHATLMSQLIAARNSGNTGPGSEYEKVRAELVKLQPPDPTLASQEAGQGGPRA